MSGIKDRHQEMREIYIRENNEDPWLENKDECNISIEPPSHEADSFLKKVESIDESFKEMIALVEKMKKIHLAMLNKTELSEKTHKDLEDLNINFKMLSKRLKEDLKSIQLELLQLEKEERTQTAIFRIKQIQNSRLQKNVFDVMTEYNDAQVKYKEKCKEILKRQIEITGREINDEEMDEMLENAASEVFIQGILHETKIAKQQLAEIQSRHEDILKIEKSVRELFEMFQDMATLITEQGESINRIENHVQNTYDYVDKAKNETKQALEYQRKARKLKVIAFLVAFIIICLVIYSIFF